MSAKPTKLHRGGPWPVFVVIIMAVLGAGCAQPPTSQVEVGKAVYQERCATCHGLERQGTDTGPALVDTAPVDIRRAVTEGSDEDPAFSEMVPLPLTAGQLDAVVAFLTEPGGSG